MFDRIFFGQQVSERIDGIKCSIEFMFEFELGHIALDQTSLQRLLCKSGLAVFKGRIVQIKPGGLVASIGHFDDQSTAATTWLEYPTDLTRNVFREYFFKELGLSRRVFAESQIVVVRVVVPSLGSIDRWDVLYGCFLPL